MSQRQIIKKTLIASAVSSVIMATGAPVLAQVGEAESLEEIVVTGIRNSLQRSQDIKRNSSGIVDSITAEDIGKFPDTNLAESLQRITGVSINRANGEGQNITVRGFGPEFNHITLNGRTIPGGGVFGTAGEGLSTITGATRAFDFANLASESVAGVNVHKTGRASIATGGIGASVDVLTSRPLDTRGFKLSTGIKGVYDSTNEQGSDITPELSALLSWSDAEGKFGIGLALSQQERDSGSRGFFSSPPQVEAFTAADAASGTSIGNFDLVSNAQITNAPEVGQLVSRTVDSRLSFADRERERTNGLLTLQYAPNESLTLTTDYLFARNELLERRGESTGFFSNGFFSEIVFDDSAVATPLLVSESRDIRDHGFQNNVSTQVNEVESLGFNADWKVNDRLKLNFDIHNSTNESSPNGVNGSSAIQVSFALSTRQGQTTDFSNGGIPITSIIVDDTLTQAQNRPDPNNPGQFIPVLQNRGNGNGVVDAGDLGSQVFRVFFEEQETDIDEARISGTYEFENGSRFNFGVENRETRVQSNFSRSQETLGNWGVENSGDIPEELVEQFEFGFDDFSTEGGFNTAFRTNAEDLLQALITNYLNDTGLDVNGRSTLTNATNPLFCVCVDPNFSISDDIAEDSTSVFLEYQFSGELGGKPFNTTIGARYEDTDVVSISNQRVLLTLEQFGDNDFNPVFSDEVTQVREETSYDNFLPSINFDVSFTDNLIARASYSTTLARTSYGNLSSSVRGFNSGGGSTILGATPTANVANPSLEPLESDNIDLSLEWYYDKSSYLSAGFFRKDVDNFVGIEQANQTLFGIRDVSGGPRAQAALAALLQAGVPVNDQTIFSTSSFLSLGGTLNQFLADPVRIANIEAGAGILVANDSDPLTQFQVGRPVNSESAVIDGVELAWQHFFGDSGFGLQANYTIVSGDVGFDVNADPSQTQFSLLGLSDSANLVGIYEKGPWQTRVAVNWRDEFLSNASQGSSRNPVFIDSFYQVDFNVSYAVSDNLSVFVEGINVTGEDQEAFGRTRTSLVSIEDLGERYNFGARYSF